MDRADAGVKDIFRIINYHLKIFSFIYRRFGQV